MPITIRRNVIVPAAEFQVPKRVGIDCGQFGLSESARIRADERIRARVALLRWAWNTDFFWETQPKGMGNC